MKVCLYFSRLFSRFVKVLAFNGSSTRFSPCDVFVNKRVSTNKEKQYNVGYYVSIADIPVPLRIGPCGGVVRVSARNNEPVGSHQCACPEFRPSLKIEEASVGFRFLQSDFLHIQRWWTFYEGNIFENRVKH